MTVTVSNSVPQAVTLLKPEWDGTAFVFSFVGQPGRTYEAHFTDVLGSSNWTLFGTLTGIGSIQTVTNLNPAAGQRFYRVESK